MLKSSLHTLQSNASSGYPVEYLVAYDPDDPTTKATALDCGAKAIGAPERWGYNELGKYFNLLANNAAGDWLLLWNDDAIMTTPGWNRIIDTIPAGYAVADLHTSMSAAAVCAFPAVHRSAVECLGYYCPPETSHTDSFWQDVGRKTSTIHPVAVHVYHDRYDLTGNNNDDVFQESRTQYRSEEYYGPVVQARIAEDAERLRRCLHG